MADDIRIVEVTADNLAEHPQVICFVNPKHDHYGLKIEWLKQRFDEGLKIKLLYVAGEKRPAGFVEYVPGEYAWRAVEAAGYLFIHCLWIYSTKHRNKGFGTVLIDEVVREANRLKKTGVAVVTSTSAFMADADLFLKHGFTLVEAVAPHQLLVKACRKGIAPKLVDCGKQLQKYRGWNIIYSKQCPWVARFIEDVKPIAKQRRVEIKFTEIKSAKDAQKAPSVYAVFNLIKDGRLLVDHYISTTRFANILSKEGK